MGHITLGEASHNGLGTECAPDHRISGGYRSWLIGTVQRSRAVNAGASCQDEKVHSLTPSVLTRPLSAEHECAHHKTSDSEHGREHPEDREGKEEGEHDQDTTYTDQDSGHGVNRTPDKATLPPNDRSVSPRQARESVKGMP